MNQEEVDELVAVIGGIDPQPDNAFPRMAFNIRPPQVRILRDLDLEPEDPDVQVIAINEEPIRRQRYVIIDELEEEAPVVEERAPAFIDFQRPRGRVAFIQPGEERVEVIIAQNRPPIVIVEPEPVVEEPAPAEPVPAEPEVVVPEPVEVEQPEDLTPVFYINSSDNQGFPIPIAWVEQCGVLSDLYNLFADAEDQTTQLNQEPINVEVSGRIMRKVCEWLEEYKRKPKFEDPTDRNRLPGHIITDWDRMFFDDMSNADLFELVNAADRLAIGRLFDASSSQVASMMRNATVVEMREKFHLKSDEEQMQIEAAQKRRDSPELEESSEADSSPRSLSPISLDDLDEY